MGRLFLHSSDRDTNRAVRLHVAEWSDCRKCGLGQMAFRHVSGRGTMPCDILFIGEAPGKTEDLLGEPFVGRSGKLLEAWISSAQTLRICAGDSGPKYFTWAMVNTVACRPCDHLDGPNRPPSEAELEACAPRFRELVELAHPRGIVFLGKVSELRGVDWPCERLALPHPAFVLRQGGLEVRRSQECIAALATFAGRVLSSVVE